jgi:Domain of unknown function (DUF4157)
MDMYERRVVRSATLLSACSARSRCSAAPSQTLQRTTAHQPSNTERVEDEGPASSWHFGRVSIFPRSSPAGGFTGTLQAKLKLDIADSPFEQEADRVAEQIERRPASAISVAPMQVSRTCAACDAELQKSASATTSASAAGQPLGLVQEVLRSPGRPLDGATRAYFERPFGRDLSAVRVHTGGSAERSARQLNADAYTVGRNIVFDTGKFSPKTPAGRRLLAHELTHVVQQAGGSGGAEDARIQRQPATGQKVCAPGLSPDDPACAGQRAPGAQRTYGPEQSIPLAALGNPPAGVGLRIPVHPHAASGIHEWSSKYGVPEGRATVINVFTVGSFRLQQVCAIDVMGNIRVYVYMATEGDAMYAVGPDALAAFVISHGGVISARPSNTDQVDQPTGLDPRKLPPAPGAFNEEPQIVYMAPDLPRYDEPEIAPTPFQIGIYLMRPYLRRLGNGQWAVLYYIAERQMTEFGGRFRPELVVGPKWLDFFTSQADYYSGIAQLGFLTPGGESAPPEYVQRSARYLAGLLHNDPERAKEGLRAWKAALKDPLWWAQVATSYAGAAQPAPKLGPPQLRIVPEPGGGGGGAAAPSTTPAPVQPVVRGPVVVRGGGAGAQAVAVQPAVEAVPVTPSPVTVPRTRPQPVPGWNRNPAPVAPRVGPPSPIATGGIVGALGAAPGKATAGKPKPAPKPDKDKDEKKKEMGSMRHQIQQGRHNHFASLAVMALNEQGVTGLQLRETMKKNFEQYMAIARGERAVPRDWTKGPVRWEKPIRAAIIAQSQAITGIIEAGGVTQAGDVNALRRCFDPSDGSPTNCESNDVRLDVENRGHNLQG